ncbi:complex I NDUFA9 subunit family protein [Beijerinckia sp. L45]|uniref:complex I NDUFA9 subunit family protein n=1 Tax=Beijerinckia sp. L45 TaxID=1641855 RepID=UPI00131DDB69|nr:complex I NDUFA9 subunit family protein [Beijerinckia sp. L45]
MADTLVRTGNLVTVFGGSGFIGRHVVQALAQHGWRVRVAARRPDLAFHLQPSGGVGQIHAVQANLRYPDSVARAVRGADAVVNLVGLLAQGGKQTFSSMHVEGVKTVVAAAQAAGITRFVQMSAIGADASSPSAYGRTKAEGEAAVLATIPQAVVLRPSVVFGPEDKFFNRFAGMARLMPALPLIGGGTGKLQPVYVGDVAEAVALGLDGTAKAGTIYELGGPEVRSFKEILEFILKTTGRQRAFVSLPFATASAMAGVTEKVKALTLGLLPEMLDMTRDQVELLKSDNAVTAAAIAEGRTLLGLGIAPESYEAIVPTYLYRFRKTGQYAAQRMA